MLEFPLLVQRVCLRPKGATLLSVCRAWLQVDEGTRTAGAIEVRERTLVT